MNEKITPQDENADDMILTHNYGEEKEYRAGKQYFMISIIHFFTFFNQPIKFFKEMKPRKTLFGELISVILNAIIPAIAIIIGSLAIVWRSFSYGKRSQPFTNTFGMQAIYISIALVIIGLLPLHYNLIKNVYNKEISKIHALFYNLRQLFLQFIPVSIGMLFIFLALIIEPVWNIDKITIYVLIIIHSCLYWLCIVIGSQIYANSGNKKFALLVGIGIFVAVIIGEQILAILFNDYLWESPTILAMYREWLIIGVLS